MREYLNLGPVPANEECEQVGTKHYNHQKARKESRVYKAQLQRLFPDADFGIKSFPHDFGSYLEVVVYYDDESAESAFNIENNLPGEWDDKARLSLMPTFLEAMADLHHDIATGKNARYVPMRHDD